MPKLTHNTLVHFSVVSDKAQLEGELSFESVLSVRQSGFDFIQTHTNPAFDLQKVQKADSAGVALLLEWLRFAEQQRKKTSFINLPESMRSLIALCGLNEIL